MPAVQMERSQAAGSVVGPTAHPLIQRYFEWSLYLLMLVGFLTLAGTGKLDVVSLVLVGGALSARAWLLVTRSPFNLSETWTNYLTFGYVMFYLADYFLLTADFVRATVHLVLFVLVVKIFSVHRERDYLYQAVLAFLMVLASATLTVDTLFLGSFALFLLIAASTFISMEMRRSWRYTQSHAEAVPVRLPKSLSKMSAMIVIAVLVGASAIFFVLPRISGGYLGQLATGSEVVSGFSETVRLGQIGRIQQSDAVIMHVKFYPSCRMPTEMRFRGVALSWFDGRGWNTPSIYSQLAQIDGGARVPSITEEGKQMRVLKRDRTSCYDVTMEPVGTDAFFLVPDPLSVTTSVHMLRITETQSVFNADSGRQLTQYFARSYIPPPFVPSEAADAPYSAQTADVYLQLPPIDRRVRELAQRVTANLPTRFEKARAIENYLLTNFGYTLELPKTPPVDPIANFLFERKQGHCEYFASSMAVMLRSIGIAARVVNGFRGAEFNDITGSYIVRGKNAHAWVEAYFPGYGWYTFDPTPAAAAPQADAWSRMALYVDAMREFWREWVVNYDFSHQSTLALSATMNGRRLMQQVQHWWAMKSARWTAQLRHATKSVQSKPRAWVGSLAIALGGILGIIYFLPVLLRDLREFLLTRRSARAPESAATVWYQRMVRLVGKRGVNKAPAETPKEFAVRIPDSKLQVRVRDFTDAYERARFAASVPDAEKLPDLYEEIAKTRE